MFRMMIWTFLYWLLSFGIISNGLSTNVSSRPVVVNVGAIFTLNSTIGRVAKIAIEEAVKDVNANSSVLRETKLVVNINNTNCSGFLGMVEGNLLSTITHNMQHPIWLLW